MDATASVGLEQGHEYSDVAAFSSCKGLLGLTGASFIVFNNSAQNEIPQFNLDINSHLQKNDRALSCDLFFTRCIKKIS